MSLPPEWWRRILLGALLLSACLLSYFAVVTFWTPPPAAQGASTPSSRFKRPSGTGVSSYYRVLSPTIPPAEPPVHLPSPRHNGRSPFPAPMIDFRNITALYVPPFESEAFKKQFWSSRYNYFGCLVAKAGTSNWLNLIYKTHLAEEKWRRYHGNFHMGNDFPDEGLYFRPSYTVEGGNCFSAQSCSSLKRSQEDKVREKMAKDVLVDPSYFKFAVVRHPWNRFLSAFKSKYIGRCECNRTCLKHEFDVPTLDTTSSANVTITELLLELLKLPHWKVNKHFRPASQLCDIGRTPYDFFGDIESKEDMEYIVERIKSPRTLPASVPTEKYLFIQATPLRCTNYTVELAGLFYAADLRNFNYTLDAAYQSCHHYGVAVPPNHSHRNASARHHG